MVVNADTVESCRLAPGNERGDIRQRPADWNPERDAEPIHSSSLIRRRIRD
jgi:hypothetical protein